MSCTTDGTTGRRRMPRGSILMEFVIVLPIYLILFGYVFLLGDMGLKTIALAVGDRDAAMDAGDRVGYAYSVFNGRQIVDAGLQAAQSATLRADVSFKGAWSWQAAGISRFSYRLPNWMSGFLVYPYLRYGSASSGGVLVTLANGNVVNLQSKDSANEPVYNYYTLKRTDLARPSSQGGNAYRNWSASQLVRSSGGSQYWKTGVEEEPFADSDHGRLDKVGGSQGADKLPSPPTGALEYYRFPKFMEWSE